MIKRKNIILLSIFIILFFTSLYFLRLFLSNAQDTSSTKIITEEIALNESDKVEEEVVYEDIDTRVNNMIDNMTLEEKVGQLFIVNLEDINDGLDCTSFNETIGDNLKKYNIGGVIFFQKNIESRTQVSSLINNLQENSKVPLLISVDEEGGDVARIGNTLSMETTKFENMIEVGISENYDRAYEIGKTIGKEIHELGFNLDFAPVADVLTNSDNVEIGDRSFGADPNIVSKMVERYVEGLQESNVSATLKHFPGHGDTLENSHEQASYTIKTLDEMRKVELLPFKLGIEKGVDFILISHLSAPNVTGSNVPASLSPIIVNDLLRNELNYENIIITDALNMGAISLNYYPAEAATEALKAGVDILLMTPDFQGVYDEIIRSVKDNLISEERINESVKRILKVKIKREIIN